MKILLMIPCNEGTIASVSYNIYKKLSCRKDVNIYVACLGKYSSQGFDFTNCYKLGDYNRLKQIILLKQIKRELHVELSISTLIIVNYLNVLSSVGDYRIGVYHTRLSQLKAKGLIYYFVHYLLDKLIDSRLDKKIAVNHSAYDDTRQRLGGNVELVYNIHDFSYINLLSEESLSVEEQKIFSKRVILYVGSGVYTVKAPDRLLMAYALIDKKVRENVNLVYVGRDNQGTYSKLKNLAEQYGVVDNIFFLGFKKNPYKYMKNATMLVSPSRDEGLPGVLIEALSLGIKCVCTNSSEGVWEIMECDDSYDEDLAIDFKTKYGYIVPNNLKDDSFTVQQISEAMTKCLEDESFCLNEFDKTRFSEESVIPHYLNKSTANVNSSSN